MLTLLKLFLKTTLSKPKALLLLGSASMWIAVGFAIRAGASDQPIFTSSNLSEQASAAIGTFTFLGVKLMIGIICLSIASAGLGAMANDQTLVYVWGSKAKRSSLALANWVAAMIIVAPVAVISAAVGGYIASSDVELAVRLAVAALAACAGYNALFLMLSLLVKRPTIVGSIYILVYELTITSISASVKGLAALSVSEYPKSIAMNYSLVDPRGDFGHTTFSTPVSIIVVCGIVLVGLSITTVRLNKMKVA